MKKLTGKLKQTLGGSESKQKKPEICAYRSLYSLNLTNTFVGTSIFLIGDK